MADGAPPNGSTPPPPPTPSGGPPPPPPPPPPVPGQAAPGWGAGPPPSYPAPGYASPGYGAPGYGAPAPATSSKRSGLAIAALVLGIVSIPLFFVILVGLLAFVLGLVASGSIKRSNGAQSGRGMARAGWILGLLSMLGMAGFVALVATGVVEGDETNVFDLEVGQCVDLDPGDADEIFSLPTVDCASPHDGEVYFVGELDGFGDEFPGDDAIRGDIELRCVGDPFTEYVGIPYADSVYGLYSLSPTAESWDEGDRGYICIATGDDLVGSIQGTER